MTWRWNWGQIRRSREMEMSDQPLRELKDRRVSHRHGPRHHGEEDPPPGRPQHEVRDQALPPHLADGWAYARRHASETARREAGGRPSSPLKVLSDLASGITGRIPRARRRACRERPCLLAVRPGRSGRREGGYEYRQLCMDRKAERQQDVLGARRPCSSAHMRSRRRSLSGQRADWNRPGSPGGGSVACNLDDGNTRSATGRGPCRLKRTQGSATSYDDLAPACRAVVVVNTVIV